MKFLFLVPIDRNIGSENKISRSTIAISPEYIAMESLADAGLATMKRFKLLQGVEKSISVDNQSNEWPKNLFLAQFDRFELWAVNLGVFVMGHGSLDYRIRDSESMKEAIFQMMKNLNRSLDESKS